MYRNAYLSLKRNWHRAVCFDHFLIIRITKLFILLIRHTCVQPTVTFMTTKRYGPLARYVILLVAHALECRERLPSHSGLAIPTCITARAWRTCLDACRDRWLAISFEVGGGKNVPGIPGACAIRNFAYLVRDPWTGPALFLIRPFCGNHLPCLHLVRSVRWRRARLYHTHSLCNHCTH